MEPKYVRLDEVVKEYLGKSGENIDYGRRLANWVFNSQMQCPQDQLVITEDIECEIVEPKQLPPI